MVALVVFGGAAWAQVRSLIVFTPDTPAVAADINANFDTLRFWLEQKVGPVNSTSLATGTVSATSATLTGPVNANSASIAGTVTAGTLSTTDTLSAGTANVSGVLTVSNVINANGGVTGAINGMNIRVKPGNNGTTGCDNFCLNGQFGTFQGSCLGSKLNTGQFTSDCSFVPGNGNPMLCLCATY